MVMQQEVIINSVDVTDYVLNWTVTKDWKVAIDAADVTISNSVSDVVTPTNANTITIKRGRTTATDEFLFEGQITQIKPGASKNIYVCKGALYEAVKGGQTKTWDKDIDTEAGVGSEIFKALCDNSSLSYSASSITSTGTDAARKIVKFVQNDEDDFQKMNELAELYDYIITYDYANAVTVFKPQGYTTYPHTLVVGTDIPSQVNWKDNMEELINKVKILGATVYDKVVDTAAGPITEMTLSKTPEDTEVRHDHAGADTLLVRGVKDVGTFGTDYDYYVEEDSKKITFASAKSDVWVRYGAQVPMPVILRNQSSINTYGGDNLTPHFKRFTYNDLKDIKDAEDRGRTILNKYSTPFITAQSIPVKDTTLSTYGTIVPGTILTINDQVFNSRTETVFVNRVVYSWPHVYDKITVGDEIWRTEEWQVDQMKKINKLFSELNKNEDIVVTVIDVYKSLLITKTALAITKYKLCDTKKLDHPINGLLDQGDILDAMETGSATNWAADFATVLTDSTDQFKEGTHSMKAVWTGGVGMVELKNTTLTSDISTYSGAASGNPVKGTIGLWLYVTNATDVSEILLVLYTDASNYAVITAKAYASVTGYDNWANLTFSLQAGWNYLVFKFLDASIVGTPDWTSIAEYYFYISFDANRTIYLDYFTISESNYIGLNGLGERLMEVS